MAYRGKHEHNQYSYEQHRYRQQAPRRKKRGMLRPLIHYGSLALAALFIFLMARHIFWGVENDRLNERLVSQVVQSVEESAPPTAEPTPTPQAAPPTPAPTATPEPTSEPTPEPTPKPEMAPIKIDFNNLRAQNKDVIGWIYCEDTPVNYPIVQREGDNEYYLNHLMNGSVNESGTIFADYRNTQPFAEWNTILYGHNMKDGSMFGIMDEYGTMDFYNQHPVMYIITPEKDYKVEICSSFLTRIDSATFQFPRTEGNPAKLIDDITRYSYINTGIIPTPEDKLISFSTCYVSDDERAVIIGVLRELYKE